MSVDERRRLFHRIHQLAKDGNFDWKVGATQYTYDDVLHLELSIPEERAAVERYNAIYGEFIQQDRLGNRQSTRATRLPITSSDELDVHFKGLSSTQYPVSEITNILMYTDKAFPTLPRCTTIALKVGDRVVMEGAYDPAKPAYIVRKADSKMVYLERPYIHHSDVEYGGGGDQSSRDVIVYTGIEEFPVERSSRLIWVVFQRVTLR